MRTRDRLAAELRKVASVASLDNALKYEAFAKRAATGEFDDFADTYACPVTQLHGELTAAGFTKFAARVADGEFDATKEESDEWANSPEGQKILNAVCGTTGQDPPHQGGLGDAPVMPEFASEMKAVAHAIDTMFNGPVPKEDKKVGFILMVFGFEDGEEGPTRCNYMSNASRKDVINMMREQLKYFEAQDLGHETNPTRPKGNA